MPQSSKRPVSPPNFNDPKKLDILGQYYFAFGQGANSMRVSRRVTRALRDRYWEFIKPGEWDKDIAAYVLDLFRAIGRLAAQSATEEGVPTIRESDFNRAAETVEDEAEATTRSSTLGKYCKPRPAPTTERRKR
jgi:hypothetical protein